MAPPLMLKHITAMTFQLPHLSKSSGVRASRIILASLPSRPTPQLSTVPAVVVKNTSGPGSIECTYSDKSKVTYDTEKKMKVEDLLRKVRPTRPFPRARGTRGNIMRAVAQGFSLAERLRLS